MKTRRWLIVLALGLFVSGCTTSYTTTTIMVGEGGTGRSTLNGKTIELEDGVLTYEGKTFDVPPNVPVRVESRNGEVVEIFVGGTLVYEEGKK